MAAITFSRLSRTLVSTTVEKAIRNPAVKPFTRLVRVMPNVMSSALPLVFHWLKIVCGDGDDARARPAHPTPRPKAPAIAA